MRHSETEDGFTLHKLATADVPPNSSIILESFMERILGIPKLTCQGLPNIINVRLAYMKTWNERLKAVRVNSPYSQTEVAVKVGVSNATVSDWESGEIHHIEGENLIKVCNFLGIDPGWLIFGKEKSDDQSFLISDPIVINGAKALQQLPELIRAEQVRGLYTLAEQIEKITSKRGTK